MNTEKTKTEKSVRGIFFPETLRRKIQGDAQKSFRTFNSQVLYLIERGLERERERETASRA